jgi:exodeoxyribonuclease VII small subunit
LATDDTEGLSFEEALSRLEQIVGRLERGDCTLEESLKLFEQGSKLRALCLARLDAAAEQIRILAGETDDAGQAGGSTAE